MRFRPPAGLASFILFAALASALHAAQRETRYFEWVAPDPLGHDTAERMFTLYDTGRYDEFDTVAASFTTYPNPFEFEAEAESWIASSPERPRRALVAAAVALELASRRLVVDMTRPATAETHTVHQMNSVLAEVGCALLREHPPSAIEQAWHAAFVAVARRMASFYQINAPPSRPPSGAATAAARRFLEQKREEHEGLMRRLRQRASRVSRATRMTGTSLFMADHGGHLLARFPDSPVPGFIEALVRDIAWALRFPDGYETLLASRHSPVWLQRSQVDEVINGGARQVRALPANLRMDRQSAERLLLVSASNPKACHDPVYYCTPPQGAVEVTLALWKTVDAFGAVAREHVAAEAYIHQGQNYARLAQPALAIGTFARAEMLATTPYELYLARLLAGAAMDRLGRHDEAIVAFRGALQAVPRAQSASFALAQLLLMRDVRDEAAALLEAAMRLPLADDPLQFYVLGDPAAVPRAFDRIRQGLRP